METENVSKFEKIYNKESDAIFRFCLVRVSNREQALDITQETFLRLWQSLSSLQDIKNERAFLFTVSHRLIIDWYRKKKSISLEGMMYREGEEGDEPGYDIVDEKTRDVHEFRAEGRYLLTKINELTETYRHPIYLHFVEGLSPKEIGDILGISANAASVRVNRGLLELRKKTGYYDGENK
ncbi:MAG: RNA polymerase sigma factor [Minisyncoccia bacterium]